MSKVQPLKLESVIGYGGTVPSGLIYHPEMNCIIYSLGSIILMKNVDTGAVTPLRGHTDKVSCMTLSKDGRYLASGQKTHMGFKADAIVWDLEAAMSGGDPIKFKLNLHKVKVQGISFSVRGRKGDREERRRRSVERARPDACSAMLW